jgi:hypothetical protein|tara:strand:+ start:1197 stop:1481 length:285 start_codon:yes stop_codon:yes gene_type:complete
MSFLNCQTTYVKNEDGTSVFTATLDAVTTKCMESFCADPEEWTKNAILSRSQDEGERIYKSELEKHLEANTMPANPTKQTLILDYEIPTVTESP